MYIYDSTLRDGAQAEGVSFSVSDKLKIAKKLDEFGIDYIEAGNPGSNPKDVEFFEKVKDTKFKNAKLVAFGSTRRPCIKPDEDANLTALLRSETSVVAIFGKSWDFHVTEVIRTTLDENLRMIYDSIAYMKKHGKEVVFDAEHFFDGYKANREYALKALETAWQAGADWLVLCDTNGGSFPSEIAEIVKVVVEKFSVIPIGIHCHNDGGMAVANSIVAVEQGVVQVQGTFNGYGERCGNANLCTIIPNLQLKRNYYCVPQQSISELTRVSRYISEVANLAPNERAPYVGNCAFAHKGGMHIDAILKNPATFEHIPPESVGNQRRILMSEVAGRSTVLGKIQKVAPWVTKDSPEVQQLIDNLKRLEHEGYQFEGAESSFELMVRKALGKDHKFFEVKSFRVLCEEPWQADYSALAVIKVEVNKVEEVTAAEGDGPVNALDKALRKALEVFYPQLKKMRLTDYKVRVLDTSKATAAKVRVHIESTDGERVWGTVGVSTNIIEASFNALIDSIEYFLFNEMGM
ncbi:citramalate synthase [Caldanaerovirga acetigignens]|uniref:citramalate synthase n=1 Tax=Caldanaerovirga acetigignens TaxID=447595 RepID=UPI000933055C|nr:citramalate synthase [Caldanaerovirga acetigignens]